MPEDKTQKYEGLEKQLNISERITLLIWEDGGLTIEKRDGSRNVESVEMEPFESNKIFEEIKKFKEANNGS